MGEEIVLNRQQQAAVDEIYGPLLVLAGPGTGKTQLLSARITNILQKTDANAQNILCLTFTENAALNMRERLVSMIGEDAYDVQIATYHGFGSDIIRSYPEFFEDIDLETGEDSRMERPIDDLQRIQIVENILNKLPYSSPLVGAKYYIKDVSSTISDLKRSKYPPKKLQNLAEKNLKQIQLLSPKTSKILADVTRLPSKASTSLELFAKIHNILKGKDGLAELANDELEQAMTEATENNKSTPLTAWKNAWLKKDANNNFVFSDINQQLRLIELAKVYEKYQATLKEKNSYDYDDMILRSIDALKNKDELRFNLQEKYQFILLDEFQDTNAAQFELVSQLANNPVNEGQPNIFAVGDDDQAIFAFQGAHVSNMLQFTKQFRHVKVINLTKNYRSHRDILETAHNVADQIESRLHKQFNDIEKTLSAESKKLPKNSSISRNEFSSMASEYSWVSDKINKLVSSGVDPKEIAVLAPQHKYLEGIVPFLVNHKIPVSYEKREDILQSPLIKSFRSMVRLILAARDDDNTTMSYLFPQILSLDFYQIPVREIWDVNWQYRTKDEDRSWAEIALDNKVLAPHVMFFLSLGLKSANDPLEYVLDYLTGSTSLKIDSDTPYLSPLKEYYFSKEARVNPLEYFEMLANLSTIREQLRAYQNGTDNLLRLQDFLDFFTAYEAANQPLINSHPIAQSENSVQLMTTYKAKGLEFEYVFLLSVHDDIWGKRSRSNSSKISLPANLQHIRYRGSSEDELRRILFVAITRAKHGLFMTSHTVKDNGKITEPVKYLQEKIENNKHTSSVLPESKQFIEKIIFSPAETVQQVQLLWESRHVNLDTNLKILLQPRLDSYQMSPTNLNSFIDLQYAGPEVFLLQTLLRFPQAPSEDGEYGQAIHSTLEWYQNRISKGKSVSQDKIDSKYNQILSNRYISPDRLDDLRNRGHQALKAYITARKDMFKTHAKTEVNFKKEGVLLGDAHLAGKIDRLEIDSKSKTVKIADFKTGASHTKWDKTINMLKYKQQLYFYKFLIEGSHSYENYKVQEARLEFVEPDSNGIIAPPLVISFDKNEEKELKKLIAAVWQKVQSLDLPDVSGYMNNYKGTMNFIEDLIRDSCSEKTITR